MMKLYFQKLACSCPPIDNPAYGTVMINNNTLGSTAHYRCDDGFKIIGVPWRICSDGCQWTDNAPTCISK